MGNAQKPTPRTRHIDIKYFSLCEWVEWDLMHLDRIDTSINMADHLTKALPPTLFHRHANFLLGHVPPTYSPVYTSIIGDFPNHTPAIAKFIPSSFTTPLTAAAEGEGGGIVGGIRQLLAPNLTHQNPCEQDRALILVGENMEKGNAINPP
jgi:hypothetical protein